MTRLGTEHEQEVALGALNQLVQSNNLVKEVICSIDDIPALLLLDKSIHRNIPLQQKLAKTLYELSNYPQIRRQINKAGVLLLILQLSRSPDPHVRVNAELALQHYGSHNFQLHVQVSIYLQMLRAGVDHIQRIVNADPDHPRRSLGLMMLKPIYRIQLKEAIRGLAECSKNQVYSRHMLLDRTSDDAAGTLIHNQSDDATELHVVVFRKSFLNMLQMMFHMRDGDMQRDLLRILRYALHLIVGFVSRCSCYVTIQKPNA
jgi:hypothetical protein